MGTLPPMHKNVNLAPHIVILGAGASIAAYNHWGKVGNQLPSMQGLIDTLSLKKDIEAAGFAVNNLNFEEFYDNLAATQEHAPLRQLIEKKVYSYFDGLELPDKPTIYDYLVLSLRPKDIIATFNWDPFLLQAYKRNKDITKNNGPQLAFLHGNVSIGICAPHKIAGLNGTRCMRCNEILSPSRLLYPVKQKDYNSDLYINSQWKDLQNKLKGGYFLTIFGYSAPKTDVEARHLLLEVWTENKTLELAEVEIIDIRPPEDIEENWKEFFVRSHYRLINNIFDSYLFHYPRRSCDAFASATLMLQPWHENPFPNFETLQELRNWVSPLIQEEELHALTKAPFSGSPLTP